jgi:hypothetical protein
MTMKKDKKLSPVFRYFFDKWRSALFYHHHYGDGRICKSYYNTDIGYIKIKERLI